MSETQQERIAREEAHWNAPRLFVLGFTFLACAVSFLYFIASI